MCKYQKLIVELCRECKGTGLSRTYTTKCKFCDGTGGKCSSLTTVH